MKINVVYSNHDFCEFVNQYCHNKKHREILIDRYCEGLTFAEIADKCNYPERHIKTIIYKHDDLIIKFVKTLEQG